MGSANKLQRQNKGPWSLGEIRVKVTHSCINASTHLAGEFEQVEKEEGKGSACARKGELQGSSIIRAFKGEDFRGGPRGGSQNMHQLSRVSIQGRSLH